MERANREAQRLGVAGMRVTGANLNQALLDTAQFLSTNHDLTGTDALRIWLAQSRGLVPLWPLLLLGVLASMGLIAEGAIYDWSVLFMKQERASDASTAAPSEPRHVVGRIVRLLQGANTGDRLRVTTSRRRRRRAPGPAGR